MIPTTHDLIIYWYLHEHNEDNFAKPHLKYMASSGEKSESRFSLNIKQECQPLNYAVHWTLST